MRVAISRLNKVLCLIAGLCLALMMVQTVVDVFLRYVMNSPIEGNLEIISFYYMVGVVFLPLAAVEYRHEHISADLFFHGMPKAVQRVVYIAGSLVAIVFLFILTYQTFLDAVDSVRKNETIMGSIFVVIWPSKWALPVGFAALSIVVLHHIHTALTSPGNFDPTPRQPELDEVSGKGA